MFPIAACRPKSPGNLEVSLLGNVIGVGEKSWNSAGGNATTIIAQSFTSSGGTVQNIRLKANDAANAKVAIYSDKAGSPNALVASSGVVAVVSGWNVLSLSAPYVTVAGVYWVAFMISESNKILKMTVGGTTKYAMLAYAAAFPATFPATSNTDSDWAIAGWGWAT